VADQLFATLDPRTRRVRLPSGRIALFTDTVGFIDKLPHDLVAAFRATLEEIADSDLILRLVDISHERAEARLRAVNGVLQELGVSDKKMLTVWNKIDRVPDLDRGRDHVIRISALQLLGLDDLLRAVDRLLADGGPATGSPYSS